MFVNIKELLDNNNITEEQALEIVNDFIIKIKSFNYDMGVFIILEIINQIMIQSNIKERKWFIENLFNNIKIIKDTEYYEDKK